MQNTLYIRSERMFKQRRDGEFQILFDPNWNTPSRIVS